MYVNVIKQEVRMYTGSSLKKILPGFMIMLFVIAGALFVIGNLDMAKADSCKGKGKISDGPLNVRKYAGTKYSAIGSIGKGKKVDINGIAYDEKKAWYRINYNGRKGYVISDYVKKSYVDIGYSKNKSGKTKDVLRVRSGSNTKSKQIGLLNKGAKVSIKGQYVPGKGDNWYRINYGKKTGYVCSKYVSVSSSAGSNPKKPNNGGSKPETDDSDSSKIYSSKEFEKYMTSQKFPSSYKPYLRKLHKAHPKWRFIAQRTGVNWSIYQSRANRIGVNLVDVSEPVRWRSTSSKVYNKRKKIWTRFDGRWYQAKPSVIAYYTDPRNFLNDKSIYQFMGHRFDKKSQTKSTIRSLVSISPCFLNTSSYIDQLYTAGKGSGVNPNVITAMIVMEQGWRGGSGLVSGRYSEYKGIYNFFNVGAYHADGMNSIQRGFWWAKGAGMGARTFGRPWNSRVKAIKGGAMFYARFYINGRQDTYYTKKFNVMNGVNNLSYHEYMTNVSGAEAEGRLLRYAYRKNDNLPIKFYIPVFNNMPSKACPWP